MKPRDKLERQVFIGHKKHLREFRKFGSVEEGHGLRLVRVEHYECECGRRMPESIRPVERVKRAALAKEPLTRTEVFDLIDALQTYVPKREQPDWQLTIAKLDALAGQIAATPKRRKT